MNKRGADKILSLYWFVILMLVAGGIFAMVYVFYGAPYDVREIEAGIFIDRIADCVSYEGRINSEIVEAGIFNDDFKDNFLEKCYLILEEDGEIQYYLEVDFYEVGNLETSVYDIKKGNLNLKSSCVVQEDGEFNKLAKCIDRSFYSLDDVDGQYIIKILGVVWKSEQNVEK